MLEGCSTNAVVAKIHAIRGKMFKAENYRELMTRRSVSEAAEYLSRSARFRDVFGEADPNTVHRGFLEELLYRENFNTYIRLCRFQQLEGQPFYDFPVRRKEIQTILTVINDINSPMDSLSLNALPGYIIAHSRVKLMEVSTAKTYEELLKALKGTRYFKILSKIPPREDGSADYTECELRLRTNYYSDMLRRVREDLPGDSKRELEEMILRDIDGRNIINAYRMKAFFGFSAAEIKRRSLNFSCIGKKRMEKIYECESAEDMLEMIGGTVYGRGITGSGSIETAVYSEKYRYLCSKLAGATSAPVALYAFVELCETDVSNIVHIIEGIRYGANPAVIESQLIML